MGDCFNLWYWLHCDAWMFCMQMLCQHWHTVLSPYLPYSQMPEHVWHSMEVIKAQTADRSLTQPCLSVLISAELYFILCCCSCCTTSLQNTHDMKTPSFSRQEIASNQCFLLQNKHKSILLGCVINLGGVCLDSSAPNSVWWRPYPHHLSQTC